MCRTGPERALRRVALGLVLLCAALPAAAAEEAHLEAARGVIERTASRVVGILQDRELSLAERRERVEAIAYDRFDFRTISRLVVGRPWRRFSPEQRERFVEDFKRLLSASYGRRIGEYEGGEVTVLGARPEPRGDVTVRTRIAGGAVDGAQVDYRMRRNEAGEWRVIDVVAEGVSLVSSYRSQFTPIVSRGGPDALLQRLEEKIAEAAEEPPEDADAAESPVAEASGA